MAVELVTVGAVCADVMARPVDGMPPRGKLALVDALEMHLGGLAGVTAAVYAQLGGTSAFIGRAGTDRFGDFIVSALAAAGVATGWVRRDAAHRTSATVVMVSGDGERTFLHHLGANAALDAADLDFDLIGGAKAFHWGGPSITPRLDGEVMGQAFARARGMGVLTSMDTCYDGRDIWLPLIAPSLPHLDVVFSSIEEARMYTGRQTPEAIAAFYRDRGVGTVAVKLGEGGLYLAGAGVAQHLPAHRVPVVDTTGAGDAACGGFLFGLLRGWDLDRCGRLANAVGALTVQHMGGAEAVASLDAALHLAENVPCR